MTFGPDVGIFAKQLRQLGVNITWVGSPSIVATNVLRLAGSALYGSYAVADFNRDSSPTAKEFAANYEAAYKSIPDFLGAWTYDARCMCWLSPSITPQALILRRSARRS